MTGLVGIAAVEKQYVARLQFCLVGYLYPVIVLGKLIAGVFTYFKANLIQSCKHQACDYNHKLYWENKHYPKDIVYN